MKLQSLTLKPYENTLTNGSTRSGILIEIIDEHGNVSLGDIAPLPKWSRETLADSIAQVLKKKNEILKIHWSEQTCFQELTKLALLPSVSFGLESALLSLLSPLPPKNIVSSALLMGTVQESLHQAKLRHAEGYTFAKLKVGHLSFDEAASIIHQLKDLFRLRIDVNRAWTTQASLAFFSKFPLDAFDYTEEPFADPRDLALFSHPLAVDESFPETLSLRDLESIPMLKALIYKPTIQGGLERCKQLHEWTQKQGVQLILSSSFESRVGLDHIASMAHRLSLPDPIGIGTHHFFRLLKSD